MAYPNNHWNPQPEDVDQWQDHPVHGASQPPSSTALPFSPDLNFGDDGHQLMLANGSSNYLRHGPYGHQSPAQMPPQWEGHPQGYMSPQSERYVHPPQALGPEAFLGFQDHTSSNYSTQAPVPPYNPYGANSLDGALGDYSPRPVIPNPPISLSSQYGGPELLPRDHGHGGEIYYSRFDGGPVNYTFVPY